VDPDGALQIGMYLRRLRDLIDTSDGKVPKFTVVITDATGNSAAESRFVRGPVSVSDASLQITRFLRTRADAERIGIVYDEGLSLPEALLESAVQASTAATDGKTTSAVAASASSSDWENVPGPMEFHKWKQALSNSAQTVIRDEAGPGFFERLSRVCGRGDDVRDAVHDVQRAR
jgi:hypothetical protein